MTEFRRSVDHCVFMLMVGFGIASLLVLSGCIGTEVGRTPSPTVLPSPTFTTDQGFKCWTAPRASSTVAGTKDADEMFVIYEKKLTSAWQPDLYKLDLSSLKYSLVVPKTSDDPGVGQPPPISPAGKHIFYGKPNPPDDTIFIYDLAKQSSYQVPFTSVTIRVDALNWSPDGKCLIFWRDEAALAYRLEDGALQEKTFKGVNFEYEVSPSPDGQWWAWPCNGGICLLNKNGQQLHHEGLQIPIDRDDKNHLVYKRGLIRWSPDSSLLAFAYASEHPAFFNTVRLVLINGQHIRSYKDINFSPDNLLWSPVDNRLMMPHGGQNTLAIYNADTEEMMTLATTEAYSSVVTPVWSPTGKQIAFVSDDAKRLYIVNTSDTETEQLPLPTDTNEKADSLIRRIYWAP